MRRRRWRRTALLAGVLAWATAAGWLVAGALRGPESRVTVAPNTSPQAPTEPPARICGNASLLAGPADSPAGAVTVTPEQRLDRVTEAHPPHSTFWLAPGVHTLDSGRYAQVRPKDGDTYVGAPGAVLDGRHRNRYAFGGYATGVTVAHLTVQHFGRRGTNGDEGVVNHDSATGWTIRQSTIRGNAGAGVMLGSDNLLRDSCLTENGQYGFSAYHPDDVRHLVVEHNEVSRNNADDWEQRRHGCGCSGGAKFWKVTSAVVRDNWVHDNRGPGLWADTNNVGFLVEGNYIADNDAEGLFYETSYNALITHNTFVHNATVKGKGKGSFPTAAIYLSESGSDPRVGGKYATTFEVSDNVFVDNWSGIVLWENADRFAGSSANTSTGVSTLVNPGVVTAETCNSANIDQQPYYDDCRWKTQNVLVTRNKFVFDPDHLGPACKRTRGCGFNGIFANWGTYPSWSPYQKRVVQKHIAFEQNNRFTDNVYVGPWSFVVPEQGARVNWATWQSAPFRQDTDSVIRARG